MASIWDELEPRKWEDVETAYPTWEDSEGKKWYTVEYGYQYAYPNIQNIALGAAFVGDTFHIEVTVLEVLEPELGGASIDTGEPFSGTVSVTFLGGDYTLTRKGSTSTFEGDINCPSSSQWSTEDYTFEGVVVAANDRGATSGEFAIDVYKPFPEVVSATMQDCYVNRPTTVRAKVRLTSIPESESVKTLTFPGTVSATFLGSTYTLSAVGDNFFEATVVAPSASSWPLQNHVYPGELTALLGEDSDSMGFTVRVREDTPPVVTSLKPLQDIFISNDCSPQFRWVVSDSESGVNRLEVTVDGKDHRYTAEIFRGVACWQMPVVTAGAHTIRAYCYDNDDNETLVTRVLTGLDLISDRTQADVNAIAALDAIPRAQMTAAEKEEWAVAVHKGAYNFTDLNRVETAVAYLAGRAVEHEQTITLTTKTTWAMTDFPFLAGQMARYLGNVVTLAGCYSALLAGTNDHYEVFVASLDPPAADSDSLDYDSANRIENALRWLEKLIDWIELYDWYCYTHTRTWAEVETLFPTWGDLEGLKWREVENDPVDETLIHLPWEYLEEE